MGTNSMGQNIKKKTLVILATFAAMTLSGHAQNSKESADSSLLQLSTQRVERHARSPRQQYSYVVHRPYIPMASGYGHHGYHGHPWQRHWHGHGYGSGHGHHHGHGNKGFYKSYKSGFQKGHGYKGKKGFKDKEGFKKNAHGNHGKWKHKGYHDEDGKKYKGHKHKKKYYGDIHKGLKGNKGHHFGTKGHHNKGHKDKGFKNVYHKEEYHHKKKFYDDYDNKKYHNKYDDIDKYIKGHKGSDFKGGHYKGGYHNDKYGSKDEKEEGEYHDNDYKVKDHYKHKKYYNDNHKHGNKKGFNGGFKEGHSESHGHGDPHDKGHDDHHGHHSHTNEQHHEAPTEHDDKGYEDHGRRSDHNQGSYSKDSPVEFINERAEGEVDEGKALSVVPPPPGYSASSNYPTDKRSHSEENDFLTSESSKKGYKFDHSSPTGRKKTAYPRSKPSYIPPKATKIKAEKDPKQSPIGLQAEALRIVPPSHAFKLSTGPTSNPTSSPKVAPNYRRSHVLPKSKRNEYKTPITSGISYSYGKKLSAPSLMPSHLRPTNPSQSEFSHSQTTSSYVPSSTRLTSHSTKAPTIISHQPWIPSFSRPLATLESSKNIPISTSFQPNYQSASNFRQNEEQTTLPILTRNQPSTDVRTKYEPENEPVSKVRQSLKYRSRPKSSTLPNSAAANHQSSSKHPRNHPSLSLSSSLSGGGSSSFTNSFSHPHFENFGNYGDSETASFQRS